MAASLMLFGSAEGFTMNSNPKPYSQDVLDNFNILKYTSNSGPWSQGRGHGLNRDPPAGCRIDQVAMIHRHGERYPTNNDKKKQLVLLKTLQDGKKKYTGSLEFLNDWKSYWEDGGSNWTEELTPAGPYSGMLNARNRGALYRARYGNLYDDESILPIFTAGYQRVTDTGRLFGMGFLGYNYTTNAALQIIPEVPQQGVNNLAPQCKSLGSRCAPKSEWKYEEFSRAAKRLNRQNNLNLTSSDIRTMMSIATYELNTRGNSPWIPVFNNEEWKAFEYYVSTSFYCDNGPGAKNVRHMALPYLNATRTLLNQGPQDSLPLIFSFSHDSYISPIVGALNITHGSDWDSYDATKVTFGERWDITDIVPQGGHLVLERLVCDESALGEESSSLYSQYPLAFDSKLGANVEATYASNYTYPGTQHQSLKSGEENIFVRFVLNEAVLPHPVCNDGPGKSCKLSSFNDLIDGVVKGIQFNADCGSPEGAANYVDFYWNWNNTNALNPLPEVVQKDAGFLDWEGNVIPDF